MRLALISLGLMLGAGCAHRSPASIDENLPEAVESIPTQSPREILLLATAHDDPTYRARALRLLLETCPRDELATFGQISIADHDAWVRFSGIESLGAHLDDPTVVALLTHTATASGVPPDARGFAGELLAGHSTEVGTALSQAWRTARHPWERAPIAFASLLHGDPDARDAFIHSISTGELFLDVAFIERVGRSGRDELHDGLEVSQERVEHDLVLAIAAARLRLGDHRGELALRRALTAPETVERLEAMDYLVDLEHPAATTLIKRARSAGPELVSQYAALALLERGLGATATLEEAASSDDREARFLAARFAARMAQMTSERKVVRVANRTLVLLADDSAAEIRAVALSALSGSAHRETLTAALAEDTLAVRLEAAGSLLRAGS